jgi:hypothetical protein
MPLRAISTVTALGLVLLALGGCTSPGDAPDPEKVKAAVQSLGGTPDTIYQQKVLSKNLTSEDYSSQVIFLVPLEQGRDFKIVDSRGEIYRDFGDFLRNNTWPRSAQSE